MRPAIDGFCQPINFQSPGTHRDFLEITGCKIRFHGYAGSGGGTDAMYNSAVLSSSADTRIVNNHFWGNHVNAKTILYVNSIDSAASDIQSYCKILITSNNFVLDKSNSDSATTFQTYLVNPAFSAFVSKLVILDAWNNFQPGSSISLTGNLSVGGNLTISGNAIL